MNHPNTTFRLHAPGITPVLVPALLFCFCLLSLCLPTMAAQAHPLDPPACYGDTCTNQPVSPLCQNSATHSDTPITITTGDPTNGPTFSIGTAQHWVSSGCNAHWLTVIATSPSFPVASVDAGIICPFFQTTCHFFRSDQTQNDPAVRSYFSGAPVTQGYVVSRPPTGVTTTTPMVGISTDPQGYVMFADVTLHVPSPIQFQYNGKWMFYSN